MTNYKLTYFGVKGRAELIRWIFTVAGKDYEDKRITFEDWPKLKNDTPFGQVPILEFDGHTVCQSQAISRYLAREFDLYGKSSLDTLYIDQAMDGLADIGQQLGGSLQEKDVAKKAEMRTTFCKEKLPKHLENYENLLKRNKGGDGYYVGDELSLADLAVTCFFNWISCLDNMDAVATIMADYPKLAALIAKVEAIPKLKAWIDSRPDTAI